MKIRKRLESLLRNEDFPQSVQVAEFLDFLFRILNRETNHVVLLEVFADEHQHLLILHCKFPVFFPHKFQILDLNTFDVFCLEKSHTVSVWWILACRELHANIHEGIASFDLLKLESGSPIVALTKKRVGELYQYLILGLDSKNVDILVYAFFKYLS